MVKVEITSHEPTVISTYTLCLSQLVFCNVAVTHLSALLPPDVCLKDTMSVSDSLYNLQLITDFCGSRLRSCCPLAVEDLLYAPPALHVSPPEHSPMDGRNRVGLMGDCRRLSGNKENK